MPLRTSLGFPALGVLLGTVPLVLLAGCPFATGGLTAGSGEGGHQGSSSSQGGMGGASGTSTSSSATTSTTSSSTTSTGTMPMCGDGNKDPGEECDDGAANSDTGDCL